MYTVGFTGTQQGLTDEQKITLRDMIDGFLDEYQVVHGDCKGADETFAVMSMAANLFVVSRPGCDRFGKSPQRAHSSFDKEHPIEPYLVRDRHIVDQCNELVACPKEKEEQLRSGTWSTVRYARAQNKPVRIIFPDGTVGKE